MPHPQPSPPDYSEMPLFHRQPYTEPQLPPWGPSTPVGLTEPRTNYLEPVHFPTANVVVHSAPKDVHGIRDDSSCMEEPPTGQLRRTSRQSHHGMRQSLQHWPSRDQVMAPCGHKRGKAKAPSSLDRGFLGVPASAEGSWGHEVGQRVGPVENP